MFHRALNTLLKPSSAAGYPDYWETKDQFSRIFFEQRRKGNPIKKSLFLSKKAKEGELENPIKRQRSLCFILEWINNSFKASQQLVLDSLMNVFSLRGCLGCQTKLPE